MHICLLQELANGLAQQVPGASKSYSDALVPAACVPHGPVPNANTIA